VTTQTAPPTTPPPQPAEDERVRKSGVVSKLLTRPEFGAVVALVLVWVFFAIVAWDNNFVSMSSTAAILNAAAPLGILAIAVSLLMIAGEFDLSIGSIVGFSGMAIMLAVTPESGGGLGWSLYPALLAALVLALAIGWFNGILVVKTRLPSFIITLGTLFIFRGLAVAIPRSWTNRTQLGGLEDTEGYELIGKLFGTKFTIGGGNFDVAILWMVGIGLLGTWILLRTRSGNWIFGVGGDSNAARNVGVPVNRLKIALFMTTALAGFIVALIYAVQFNGADSLRGTQLEFRAIIEVVVGGTLLTGGYGSVIGAMLGAIIFAMVQQGIVITGVDGDWFQVFLGGILVLAVIFNNFIRQQAQKR
jgi:simple sugar transport system permease protein